jgi:hypothetical protein
MRRYAVQIQGPTQKHEMTVFAGDWNSAAEAGVDKIQDKILRHNFKGWGPVSGPWTVLSVTFECE